MRTGAVLLLRRRRFSERSRVISTRISRAWRQMRIGRTSAHRVIHRALRVEDARLQVQCFGRQSGPGAIDPTLLLGWRSPISISSYRGRDPCSFGELAQRHGGDLALAPDVVAD